MNYKNMDLDTANFTVGDIRRMLRDKDQWLLTAIGTLLMDNRKTEAVKLVRRYYKDVELSDAVDIIYLIDMGMRMYS
jgi:hypothetical protein